MPPIFATSPPGPRFAGRREDASLEPRRGVGSKPAERLRQPRDRVLPHAGLLRRRPQEELSVDSVIRIGTRRFSLHQTR